MQTISCRTLSLLAVAGLARGDEARADPLGKVLQLLGDLQQKIKSDGEMEDKSYHKYHELCDDSSKNAAFAIKTATKSKAELEASIIELSSNIEVASSKIDRLASAIGTSQSELTKATSIRKKEATIFAESEKELADAVDALGRAVGVLEREMEKNPASFTQLDTSSSSALLQSLTVVMEAAAFNVDDKDKLTALVQAQAEDTEDEFGAPASAAYKSQSGGVMDVLQDMKEKADGQLGELRQAEVKSKAEYDQLKQALKAKSSEDAKDLEDQKSERSAGQEGKASAEGELEQTTVELKSSQSELDTIQKTCIGVAADHEATVVSRKQEIEILAKAKKMLEETTGGASSQSYSFVQAHAGTKGNKIVTAVRRLAKQQHSAALAQLASRIAAVLHHHLSADPFSKVKGLIQDMVAKLERQAKADATEKAYCDEQMAKTAEKQGELQDDVEKMTSSVDEDTARSTKLNAQVRELESELSNIAREQADMDKVRQDKHAGFLQSKADLEQGLSGVRQALDVLRDYYNSGSAAMLQEDSDSDSDSDSGFNAFMQQPEPPKKFSKSAGAGGGIIDILEIVESDFAKNLAKEETEESNAASNYEKLTQENKLAKAAKEQDVKYKSAEIKSLQANIAEVSGDRETAGTELAAVNDYFAKIRERCVAKPESYKERKTRRAAEIQGLKEALTILDQEAAFVQRKRRFRGAIEAH